MASDTTPPLTIMPVSPREDTQLVTSTTRRSSSISLVSWSSLEPWQQDESPFVERGYRKAEPSMRRCLHSLTYFHNETVNISSLAVGALAFIILYVWFFASEGARRSRLASSGDMAVVNIYFASVTISFLSSACIHTFMCQSKKALELCNKLDFQGLVLMIWGATVPLVYYAFCDLNLQVCYLVLTSVAAFFCTLFNFQLSFSKPHLQHLRALGLGCLALSFFVPVVHSLATYGLAVQIPRLGLRLVVYTLICHTFCAATYATEFPERFFPRTYDIFGASRQIFHVMLLAGAAVYAVAVSQQFDFRHDPASASWAGV